MTANDPRAPLDEVRDASRQVMKAYYDPDLAPPDMIGMFAKWAQLQQIEALTRPIEKALTYGTPQSKPAKARTEPIVRGITGAGGRYVPKPGLPFLALRQLSERIEVAQAIHRTRKRQVQRFAAPSRSDDMVGWRLVHIDDEHEVTPDQAAYMEWLTRFLQCGGREFAALDRRRLGRNTFRQFLGLLVDDALSLDHVAVETVGLVGAVGLDSFWVRDSATFYLATNFGKEDTDDLYAVQEVALGGVENFAYDELAIFQRNLSTDLERMGYGRSELEASVETISNWLQAMAFTREGIDNNAIPRGILMVSGNIPPQEVSAFKAQWQAKLRGAQNAFGLPMVTSRGQQGAVQFVQTGQPFSEMAFAKWIALQAAIMGAIYGISPAEIGMESFSADKSSLSGNDTAERLAAARDQGLEPFLTDIEGFISDELVARFAPMFRFRFTGLNPGDEAKKAEERARMSTIDELRTSLSMEPHPIPSIGALPADPGVLQAEFQRYQTILTVDEARKCWGGLEAYPDPKMGAAPINPQLQAIYSQMTQPEPDPADNPFAQGDPNAEPGEVPEGLGSEVHDKLQQMGHPALPFGGDDSEQ